VTANGDLLDEPQHPHGSRVTVAGLVLVRQRPGTASGIMFMTIEDETGVANLVVHPNTYERFRAALRQSVAIIARGKIERQGQVIHVFVQSAEPLTGRAKEAEVAVHSRDFR
jgi:DNA polymerase III alpha subunit